MERLKVTWMVPAREGNTCYRPEVETASLRERFEEVLESVDDSVELNFEQTLTTSADRSPSPRLLIEGRPLAEWSYALGENHWHYWEATVKPELKNHNVDSLRESDFLESVLDFVLDTDDPHIRGGSSMTDVRTKRIYEEPDPSEEYRVLVDRLWPRGVSKEEAELDDWRKNLAPSDELREWFDHDPQKWEEFRERYRDELSNRRENCRELLEQVEDDKLTLLYAAKDPDHNNARVLRGFLGDLTSGVK